MTEALLACLVNSTTCRFVCLLSSSLCSVREWSDTWRIKTTVKSQTTVSRTEREEQSCKYRKVLYSRFGKSSDVAYAVEDFARVRIF